MSDPARDSRELVGPYRLIRAIGAGGSARIDLARIDRAYGFQRHVVVKRPLEHLRGDAQVAASLQREARIGGRLRHPNLVAVLDAGVHDGYDYLVLEYIHGAPLRTLMQTENGGQVRAVPLAVALGIAIDVARGIHEAHELADERGSPLGLVHRDVSPGNVLLGLDGAVKLADFGIAKETRVTTLSGSMHGTVTYMAPEQCRGHAFDRRADIFSIGVILYELATRVRLFWADNDVASLHRVLSGQIERPRKLNPELSPAFEEIVMTAVAQDPERRFATARQLAEALEGFATAEGHVVGARWVARAVEDVLGATRAPWVAAPPAPPEAAPSPSEISLVGIIESLEAEPEGESEPLWPAFGPEDERAIEEVPAVPLPAASRRSGKLLMIIAAVSALAGAVAIWIVSGDRSPSPRPSPSLSPTPPPPPMPTPPPPSSIPMTPPSPTPTATAPAPAPPTPTAVAHPHRRPIHATPLAGSDAHAIVPPPDPAAGSAVKPPPSKVEWKPTMLLPSDNGKSKP